MKISEALRQFVSALEIDTATIKEAKRLHATARAALEEQLTGCVRTTLSGSYPRNTRLAPLDDIDIIAVVENTDPWHDDPNEAVKAGGQIVADAFPGSTMKLGYHAAKISNIDSTIDDVHLDIVVGYEIGSGTTLKISELKPTPRWIKSDPEAHARALIDANAAWNERLKPTVKMVKHWNRQEEDDDLRMPSFLIEAIVLHAFEGSGSLSFQDMVHRYFDRAAEKIKTPTTSPAVPDGYVDADMERTRRDELSKRLRRAANDSAEAIRVEADDPDGAQEIWYRLFGDPFPKPDATARAAEVASLLRNTGAAGIAGGTVTISPAGRSTVPGRAYGEK